MAPQLEGRDLSADFHAQHLVIPAGETIDQVVGGDETIVEKAYDPATQEFHLLVFRARLDDESLAKIQEARDAAEQQAANKIVDIADLR